MTPPLFNDPDQQLLQNYWPDQPKTTKRRPPWTWSILTDPEREALTARICDWVDTYNQCYAVEADQLIPLCWPQHGWLAEELAVMTWLWYSTHRDPTATAERAGEFYLRYLPGFRIRLTQTLGRSPVECQKGRHPNTWRRDAEQSLSRWPDKSENQSAQVAEFITAKTLTADSQRNNPSSAR